MADKVEQGLQLILSVNPSYLQLSDVIAIAQSSHRLLTLCQQHAQWLRVIDLSLCKSPGRVLAAATSAALTKRGKVIREVRCQFNKCLHDEDLDYLPSNEAKVAGSNGDGGVGLEVLNLNGCHNITDVALEIVARKCRHLREFEIYWNIKVTDGSVSSVLRSSGHYLKVVNLSGCKQLSDEVVKTLTTHCPNIEDINLTRCSGMTDLSVSLISEKLAGLKRFIIYACHHMPPGNFAKIARLKNLVELDLTGTHPNEEEVNTILRCCRSLRRVNLTWVSRVTDTTLEVMAANCPDLSWISVYGNQLVTCKGFQKLIQSDLHRKITALDIRGCVGLRQYAVNDRELLKAAFPQCEHYVLHS